MLICDLIVNSTNITIFIHKRHFSDLKGFRLRRNLFDSNLSLGGGLDCVPTLDFISVLNFLCIKNILNFFSPNLHKKCFKRSYIQTADTIRWYYSYKSQIYLSQTFGLFSERKEKKDFIPEKHPKSEHIFTKFIVHLVFLAFHSILDSNQNSLGISDRKVNGFLFFYGKHIFYWKT